MLSHLLFLIFGNGLKGFIKIYTIKLFTKGALKMNKYYSIIRQKLKYGFTVELYNFLFMVFPKKIAHPKVATIDETINRIVDGKCSVSRFGDGEVLLIGKNPIRFQHSTDLLSQRLAEIIQSENENHLVCISDVFDSLKPYNRKARRFWRTNFYIYGDLWNKYLVKGKIYYNTFMTRPYMDYKNKEAAARWFPMLKQIWNDRDIVFIEGEKSRLGVGNDLFSNARSIRRILGPAMHAFDKYDELLAKAKEVANENTLFLCALGPTATVISYDLFKAGYQAVDVGHVDIEYEWFRMKVTKKVKIPSKYTNEAADGSKVGESTDEVYQSQIIAKII